MAARQRWQLVGHCERHGESSRDRSKTKGCSSSMKRLAVTTNATRAWIPLALANWKRWLAFTLNSAYPSTATDQRDCVGQVMQASLCRLAFGIVAGGA